MAGVGKRTYLREVNPYLICPLCRGYLIDATTVVECLHSFCRSCILKHLNTEAQCPSCKHVINKAKPNIKADKALQDIVYKLVPGLYHKEMRKRREFYKKHPEHADSATPEQRGEDVSGRLIFAPEDAVSLSLEYLPPGTDPLTILLSTNDADPNNSNSNNNNNNNGQNNGSISSNRRYLQCPALVTIAHLKKFLALKYSVDMTRYTIEICHRRAPLPEHWTLMDVAYIYAWKRNAPIRFFYRIAQEEQRLEAPLHDRPSTPGLGASLPPTDNTVNTRHIANTNSDNIDSDIKETKSKDEHVINVDKATIHISDNENSTNKEPEPVLSPVDRDPLSSRQDTEKIDTNDKPNDGTSSNKLIVSTTTTSTMTVTTSNTTTSSSNTNTTSDDSTKQMKSPIKILKNPDGRYEVLRSPPAVWSTKDQNGSPMESKTSPEFSVVSIGDGQNSNGVKITLKQCSPTSTNSKKPKITSSVLIRCAQPEKDPSEKEVTTLQQIQKEKEKEKPQIEKQQQTLDKSQTVEKQQTADKQQIVDKQEKQKRRVTFVDKSTSIKTMNNVPKAIAKKPTESHEKKQFLQSFQLTARESVPECDTPDSSNKSNQLDKKEEIALIQNKTKVSPKKEIDNAKKDQSNKTKADESNTENSVENTTKTVNNNMLTGNKRVNIINTINNVRNTVKQFSSTETRMITSNTTTQANGSLNNNHQNKVDVYAFPSDPPIVPAGAVKRKCPPGLPIFDVKRKKLQPNVAQTTKKQTSQTSTPTKSPRKAMTMEPPVPRKRPANVTADPGPSRTIGSSNNTKPAPTPMLSNDTRNLLDGCGLNIPASLSITLTAPKSPGSSSSSVDLNDSKDARKNALGKVSPSITLNDRSVDPRVLKALKAGQIRMPAPPRPKQTKQTMEREVNPQQRQQQTIVAGKRKRDQETRDILDLSGGKKAEIHPLRIPQPVSKPKAKPIIRESVPAMIDQGQVVTLIGGHRYYKAPPGSLTPAAHRVPDYPLPTPTGTPVYAPSLSSSVNTNRSNTNLSSVFPSLQSLYALSQAPSLQQFQMDARMRVSRTVESTSFNKTETTTTSTHVPNKTHIPAQCAPVKPARSSVAPLAIPINKQDRSTSCLNRSILNDAKSPIFRSPEPRDADIGQRLTIENTFSPPKDNDNGPSRDNADNNTQNNNTNNSDQERVRDSETETSLSEVPNNSDGKERPQQQRQHHREAASPRVSSTASPSPPPGNRNSNANGDDCSERHCNDNASNTTGSSSNSDSSKDNTGAEVTSSKSPASPDSSSITIESSSGKTCTSTEQSVSSPAQTTDRLKSSEISKSDENLSNKTPNVVSPKQSDTKQEQLTSEILQKRLLAAFPTNEWANNPIVAEHLGNFLKSLNASIKVENHTENSETNNKVEAESLCGDSARGNDDITQKTQKEVSERS